MNSLLDSPPLWLLFVATLAVVLLAVEIGFRTGVHRARISEDERQAPIDAMVGSTLGLLAFVLAFTFGMASARYDARKQLVLDDAIAIGTADLRAQQLREPDRSQIRRLLLEYVDLRVEGLQQSHEHARILLRSEELHEQLWALATALGQDGVAVPFAGELMRSLIEMRDVHSRRVMAVLHNRIPVTIWIALYCLTVLAMAMTGYRAGLSGRRSLIASLTLVLAFSSVIFLIADLDRPYQGFLKVSQQAMIDLQTRLHRQ